MFASYLSVALLAVSAVSGMAVPRATAPKGYSSQLENYDVYHTRYMALACSTKHSSSFFDQCCHPLSKTQSLSSRPAQCTPATAASSTVSSAAPSATAGSEDECDEGDEDCECEDESTSSVVSSLTSSAAAHSSTVVAKPTTTAAPTPTTTAAPKPTTTAAPKPTTSSVKTTPATTAPITKQTSGSVAGGFATFFTQNGVAGACGVVHKDTDFIAAIDGRRYGDLGATSLLCGEKVTVTNTKNKKSVTVTIVDACPTCENSGSIDLSVGAFTQIATEDEGMVPVTYTFVGK